MDIATDIPEPGQPQGVDALSYDDTIAYEQQLPSAAEVEAGLDPRSNDNPLANRISSTKVYLLSETSAAARKRDNYGGNEIIFDRTNRVSEPSFEEDEMEGMDEDVGYRTNAILLQGTPISQLPTARIFAYAKHFDTTPLGLEWVNDETCVLVYPSSTQARAAFTSLQKSSPASAEITSETATDIFVIAKPIPLSLWPPQTRINKTLGTSSGLSGTIQMRWATPSDVKKKGAKHESEFYRRHGEDAGKEIVDGRDLPPATQRLRPARHTNGNGTLGGEEDRDFERQRLDAELDQFLRESESDKGLPMGEGAAEADDIIPPSPPSKMRSDYIADDGRTLLDEFSDPSLFESDKNPAERAGGLRDRLNAVPQPRRSRGTRGGRRHGDREGDSALGSSLWDRLSPADVDSDGGVGRDRRRGGSGRSSRHHPYERDDPKEGVGRGGRRGEARPKKTQQELDDELEAFLKQG